MGVAAAEEMFYGSCKCFEAFELPPRWLAQSQGFYWNVPLKWFIEATNVLKPAFELPDFCHLAGSPNLWIILFCCRPIADCFFCLVGLILELWRYNFSQKYFVFTFTLCFMIDWLLNWKSVQNSHIVKRASCPLPSINSLKESFLTKLW